MLFGDKYKFAIEYNFIEHPYGDERGILHDSWGGVRLWIDGVDLFQYKVIFRGKEMSRNYEWNLCMIVEWLCENLHTIVTISEFPNNIQAMTAFDYLEQNELLRPEFETEDFLNWHKGAHEWLATHWVFYGADGSNLPNLFLRRIDDKIEFSWNNEGFLKDREIFFCSKSGYKLIDMNVFYKVVKEFLNDFIRRFKNKYPVEMKTLQDKIILN